MNSVQRLFSNTALAFIASLAIKASSSVLFIFIGRQLGPANAGVYNLGITYFTITLALSAWGLHELLVREVATRREQSANYLLNYLAMRMVLTAVAYASVLLLLRFVLPYSDTSKQVIAILALAVFPEAVFSMLHSLFVAHEQMSVPTLAAFVNSGLKFGLGIWLLFASASVTMIAWVIPIGSTLSLLIFVPALIHLVKRVPQQVVTRLSISFSIAQLRYTPGFILIGIFTTLDFQLDALLISFLLTETDIGWYGATQTIMLAFWMMPIAFRTALYPIMVRYYQQDQDRLAWVYQKSNHYLLIIALPIAAGISLLAYPIIRLVFGSGFEPAAATLQWMIWAVIFAFLNVPSARLLLVYNRQHQAGWMTGISMVTNALLNLLLIPRLGIIGAGLARTLSSAVFFWLLFIYVQRHILRVNMLPQLWKPFVATMLMAGFVWLLRDFPLWTTISVGVIIYTFVIFLLRAVPAEDIRHFQRLYESG